MWRVPYWPVCLFDQLICPMRRGKILTRICPTFFPWSSSLSCEFSSFLFLCFFVYLSFNVFFIHDWKHVARRWQTSHWSFEHFIWRALRKPDCVLSQQHSFIGCYHIGFFSLFIKLFLPRVCLWFLNIAKLWQAAVCQFLWIFIAFALMHAFDQAELYFFIFHVFVSIYFSFLFHGCLVRWYQFSLSFRALHMTSAALTWLSFWQTV